MMGLTTRGEPKPVEESIRVMKRALELGADNWNAGEFYGESFGIKWPDSKQAISAGCRFDLKLLPVTLLVRTNADYDISLAGPPDRNSMHLLREYFTQYPDDASKVILCVKGGVLADGTPVPDSSVDNIHRSVDTCLDLIKDTSKKTIDIFECARVDPKRGNEQALEVLAEYVKAGKLGGIGLSEVSAKTIRASQKQVKELGISGVASVEIELSLWTPDVLHNGILAACAELEIPVFAYSPLARGALSDNPIRKNSDIPEDDFRRTLPKYQDDVLAVNNQITDAVSDIAKKHGLTTAQVAIAWVRGQSNRTRPVGLKDGSRKELKLPPIIPIPGASSIERVEENLKDVVLSEDELKTLDELVEKFPTQGDRYHPGGMQVVNG